MGIQPPRTDDVHEQDAYAARSLEQTGTDQVTVLGGVGAPSQDIQVRICGPGPDYPGSIEFWAGVPGAAGSQRWGVLSMGQTVVSLSNKQQSLTSGIIAINQSDGKVSINKVPASHALDISGETIAIGKGGPNGARLRFTGYYYGSPTDNLPAGCGEISFSDLGNSWRLMLRYNHNGDIKYASINLT